MSLGLIHSKILEICPILGVSGSLNDIPNLRIDFADEATQEQKEAALALISNWEEGASPNVELFIGTLKSSTNFPLEFLPYLSLWSPVDILNEQARRGFWAKVKASKPYFMTPEIIQSVEQLAVQCNLPLE